MSLVGFHNSSQQFKINSWLMILRYLYYLSITYNGFSQPRSWEPPRFPRCSEVLSDVQLMQVRSKLSALFWKKKAWCLELEEQPWLGVDWLGFYWFIPVFWVFSQGYPVSIKWKHDLFILSVPLLRLFCNNFLFVVLNFKPKFLLTRLDPRLRRLKLGVRPPITGLFPRSSKICRSLPFNVWPAPIIF